MAPSSAGRPTAPMGGVATTATAVRAAHARTSLRICPLRQAPGVGCLKSCHLSDSSAAQKPPSWHSHFRGWQGMEHGAVQYGALAFPPPRLGYVEVAILIGALLRAAAAIGCGRGSVRA